MEETGTSPAELKERRGKTLPVLVILSRIYIGLSLVTALWGIIKGPMTQEQLDEEKIELLAPYSGEQLELVKPLLEDIILAMEIENEHHYLISTVTLITLTIGFFAVLWMNALKKKGFYLYLVYSIIPLVFTLILYAGTQTAIWGTFIALLINGTFCILYGVQSKRMQ